MSKCVRVVMPDDEFRLLARAARRRGKPVAEIVREAVRRVLAEEDLLDPDERIAAVLRFARFSGPTGSIARLLREIERSRAPS